jgi:hypothetical protein
VSLSRGNLDSIETVAPQRGAVEHPVPAFSQGGFALFAWLRLYSGASLASFLFMAKTTEAIAGFFRTRDEGEKAREALIAAGFNSNEIGYVAGDTRGHQTPRVGPVESVGAESEAVQDAWVGGVVGLAAGMIAVVIPGLGPLIAAGPLAGAIGGLGVGAATGGIIGLLKDHGVTEEEAAFYAEGVKKGGSLVTVNGVSGKRASDARQILQRHGAIDTENLDD